MFNCWLGSKRDKNGLKKGCKVFALCPKDLRWYWATITGATGRGEQRKFSVRAIIGFRVGMRKDDANSMPIDLPIFRYATTMVTVKMN
jgi:hypothetical protein